MKSLYNVPVIPQNLRREETIVQIAEALNYLEDISTDILNRVNTRISSNSKKLNEISNRVDTVRLKIDKLSGAKKATQVFSSSKYPATDVKKRYKSIFQDGKPLPMEKFNIDIKSANVKSDQLETLLFYHVKVKDGKKGINLNGLGEMPAGITSVNDLLLFNSNTNPYSKYVMSDPLQGSKTTRKEEVEINEIGAAPASIIDKKTLIKSTGQSFSYTPYLGEVPAIDVPIHLPDLPGIADDLRYVNEIGPGIAPSVTTTPNTAEKPIVDTPEVTKAEPVVEVVKIEEKKVKEEVVPPPVTEAEIKPKKVVEEIKEEVKENPVEKPVEKVEVKEKSKPVEVTDSGDFARANLMEAIRQAGGKAKAKLKSSEPKPTSEPVTGDLMSDLYAKLAMRRKGISGSKGQSHGQIESGSVMYKVASMIPPPPQTADSDEQTDNANTDQEWDD